MSATIAVVIIAVILAEAYSFVGGMIGVAWIAAAILHTLGAFALVGLTVVRGRGIAYLSLSTVENYAPEFLRRRPLSMYLPALVVLLFASLAILASRQFSQENPPQSVSLSQIAWVLWIPIIEEIVFRWGFGQQLRLRLGNIWGSWFSALLFALVHVSPTIMHLSEGKIGLPLGPFLLGLSCELLFILTGRLVAAIALHAACNGTAIIFALGDDRWLNWLDFLYG